MRKAAREFNAGRFFECHDTLEEVWRGVRGPARDFFQGLIQVAVGFYHLDNRNLRGAKSQLEKGLAKLDTYGDEYLGVELARFRRSVRAWLERIREGAPARATLSELPRLSFLRGEGEGSRSSRKP